MQNASTPLDHMYAIVSLDLPEMDKIAQVNFDRFYLNNREASTVLCSVTKPTGSSYSTKDVMEDNFVSAEDFRPCSRYDNLNYGAWHV